jgi:hypothetical protein
MAPDDVEHSRMEVLQLRGLPLLKLSLHHSAPLPTLPYLPFRAIPVPPPPPPRLGSRACRSTLVASPFLRMP